jgi:hypothetical protein
LQSSHGATQLNLGNLSHPKQQEISQGRGEGFELRTDAMVLCVQVRNAD